ncbi:hypothetical protein MNAN1_000295 [Malassezia nana]|uniref:Elongation factor 1-gamma n=1 Tax=Malassezia nana TaxID=180528 RepID=A0AAF0J0S8_9BASI|nr:hypothetical protein MNAN1_000295 [Malassezia nana]
MASIGKIYGAPTVAKVVRVVAAANVNGLELEVVPTLPIQDSHKPEFLAKFPLGKVPTFEGSDGFILTESRSILKYVAGLSDNAKLLGTDKASEALVDQWINFSDDLLFNNMATLFLMFSHKLPFNKVYEQRAWSEIEKALGHLEKHLVKQTFLVGHRVTAADLSVAAVLSNVFANFAGPEIRSKYPHVQRYLTTVVNQKALRGAIPVDAEFCAETAKFVPPKKEEKPKAASAPAAAAQEAPAAPKEEKPKNPLDALPKSSFVVDEWKRVYSNEDTRSKAIPWFYEHFDKDGWSIWRFDFKYNDELTQIFMSSNQIGGFFNRLEASRKYIMGTAGVFGQANDSKIAGIFIVRGHDWEPVLSVAPDLESYTVTPLDVFNKDEDKKFFEDMLAWEAVIDGKAWADGKILK